jgi:hypothetical protein
MRATLPCGHRGRPAESDGDRTSLDPEGEFPGLDDRLAVRNGRGEASLVQLEPMAKTSVPRAADTMNGIQSPVVRRSRTK